jgi:hypothetical protein
MGYGSGINFIWYFPILLYSSECTEKTNLFAKRVEAPKRFVSVMGKHH